MKEISNRSASYHFHLEQMFTAGMVLSGTEVKSIRSGKVSFNDSFCFLDSNGELFIRNLHIAGYSHGTSNNHVPTRERKLLLQRRELRRIMAKTKEKGYTIIPVRIFFSESGFAKLEIALAKGRNSYDKRQHLKSKDLNRELRKELRTV